jgi:hypothetical protein
VLSDAQQRLGGAAFVHRPITFRDLGDRQFQIEDATGLDLASDTNGLST